MDVNGNATTGGTMVLEKPTHGLRNGILLGAGVGALASVLYPIATKKPVRIVAVWGIAGAMVGTAIFLGIVYYQETHH